ncbi:hypothetical protein ACA910_018229 [Epithemia clementina (nom. ined.)]
MRGADEPNDPPMRPPDMAAQAESGANVANDKVAANKNVATMAGTEEDEDDCPDVINWFQAETKTGVGFVLGTPWLFVVLVLVVIPSSRSNSFRECSKTSASTKRGCLRAAIPSGTVEMVDGAP